MDLVEKPLVSVVIPVFNRADLIGRTIESALAQSLKNIEIIVVDDASTDNTGTVIQKISDPRIKYSRLLHNSGPSGARNTGVKQASGEFVAFLDSDDEWDTRKLELQLAAIRQQTTPHNIVCYTKVIVAQDNSTYLLPTRGKDNDESVGDYVLCGSHGLIHTSSILLSRNLAAANPFPIEQRVFEDWDLFLRLEAKGVKWLYLDQALATWNNKSREDRLSLSKHDGSIWLDQHRLYLSTEARNAFAVKGILRPLIRSRQKKLYSFKLLFRAMLGDSVSFTEFLKLTIRIFLPPALITYTKALLFRRPQRRTNS